MELSADKTEQLIFLHKNLHVISAPWYLGQ